MYFLLLVGLETFFVFFLFILVRLAKGGFENQRPEVFRSLKVCVGAIMWPPQITDEQYRLVFTNTNTIQQPNSAIPIQSQYQYNTN
jgi:hypothetical protein